MLLGRGGAKWALEAVPLLCAADFGGFPCGFLGVPTVSWDGVGARCAAPCQGEVVRAGDLSVGVLQSERAQKGERPHIQPHTRYRDGRKKHYKKRQFRVQSHSVPHLHEGTLRGCAGSWRGLGVVGVRGWWRWPWGAQVTGGSGLCERLTSRVG